MTALNVATSTQRRIVFYLLPEFTLLAFSSALEALRLANEVLGFEAYSWRTVSAHGGKVFSSAGLAFDTDSSVAAERQYRNSFHQPTAVIVCAGKNVEMHRDRIAEAWLRECHNRGTAIGSLCTGAHVLANAGLLNDRRCSIHWETIPGFMERFLDTEVALGIYHLDDDIFTCAGGTASFDMMLHIIERDFGQAVASGVCELALVDHPRAPESRQRLPFAQRVGTRNPRVLAMIAEMEKNLGEPRKIEELLASAGRSRRQLERLFKNELGFSPARYYLKLRLERAKLLLLQTSLPIVDVAIACGFVSGSHFSRCYRVEYGCSPDETRRKSAAPRRGRRTPVVEAPRLAEVA